MGVSDGYFGEINLFKYGNKKKPININGNYGETWASSKTKNKIINSIMTAVDNGDGKIQPQELNTLNKIFLYIDSLIDKTKNDGILEEKELNLFKKKLDKGEIKLEDIINEKTPTDATNWSEGVSRNISKIKVSTISDTLKNELTEIGKQEGFKVEEMESGGDYWVEDSSIRRADGKRYVSLYDGTSKLQDGEFTSERNNVSTGGGARVFSEGNAFDLEIDKSEMYYGTSYLEGGNVLNTLSKDGKPAAIIGESSISYTLNVMNLENTPENVKIAKEQISKDLGLKQEDVTFIPQYDFHIDMLYHPLNNGEVAIPDFDEAIKILKENDIKGMSEEEKNNRIDKLEKLRDDTAAIREEAENNLKASGYKLVKIPNFTTDKTDKTNFMNGVGGTSTKTGNKFYITNKSEFSGLQDIVEKYFKNAGIDKVYFVSTTSYLKRSGGIDCLTQEE